MYYGAGAGTVGYAISPGRRCPEPGARPCPLRGQLTLGHQGTARSITWLRDCHTCVVAGRGPSYGKLLALVGSDAREAVGSQAAAHVTHARDEYL